LVIGVKS